MINQDYIFIVTSTGIHADDFNNAGARFGEPYRAMPEDVNQPEFDYLAKISKYLCWSTQGRACIENHNDAAYSINNDLDPDRNNEDDVYYQDIEETNRHLMNWGRI